MPNKEQIYDAEVAPLMTQVIELCSQHGIALFATFDLSSPDNEALACTTILPDETGYNPDLHLQLASIALPELETL